MDEHHRSPLQGAARRHLRLETSWPLLLLLGSCLAFLELWCRHLSWDRLGVRCPTLRAPLGGFNYGVHGGGGLQLEECGRFCDKGWFPN